MTEIVVVHQTLHGYADGHQMLSSSLELTREQQWQMLVMSDLSGPAFVSGFESYLTGYPLKTAGFYCLARTWYAPELPRPGCVWTHTILISDTDMAHVDDFRAILSHFCRPTSRLNLDAYGAPIQISPFTAKPFELDANVSTVILSLLYGSSPQTVILTSDASKPYEELTIALLNQQWPRLRRSFHFCTGALASRDATFDFMVAPPNVIRQMSDSNKKLMVSSKQIQTSKLFGEDWVQLAATDLLAADPQSSLRQFLWKFGPDYNDGRIVFRALCEIHLALSRNTESVEQVLSATAHFFPDSDSSKRLKAELFSTGGYYSTMLHGESSVLHALVTHPEAKCIPEDIAAIENRAQRLASFETENAIKTAITASNIGGIRANHFLNGFAEGIAAHPGNLSDIPLALILNLLKRRPELAASPELWKRSAQDQLAIALHISSLRDVPSGFGRNVTMAVVNAKAWQSLAAVLAYFGQEAVLALLTWLNERQKNTILVPKPVLNALSDHRDALVEAMRNTNLGICSLHVVSTILDPRADNVRALGTRVWSRIIDSTMRHASIKDEIRSRTFFLSLGLSLPDKDAALLVRYGFSEVYEAARSSNLDDTLWQYVDPYLPWYLVVWDRCARLTRGVVKAFVAHAWPISEFFDTFTTEEQFGRAIEEADRTSEGSRYITRICALVRDGTIILQQHHMLPLSRYCDRS